MSDIDLIKHYRIGVFCQLPVYLCRENGCWLDSQKKLEPSSVAKKKAICIDGGSGEHPSLVINDPPNCVAIYLRHAGVLNESINSLARQRTTNYMIYCDGMTRAQWKDVFKKYYDTWRSDLTFDRWIAAVIGEFIFFMMPEQYHQIHSWRSYTNEISPYFHSIDIPWDEYEGNGIDYFEIKRRN